MSHTLVTVTAVRSFQFEDRQINKGDDVTLPAIHAAIEARKGNVSLAKGIIRTREITPEPEPTPVRRRRTYTRRDMTAEPS